MASCCSQIPASSSKEDAVVAADMPPPPAPGPPAPPTPPAPASPPAPPTTPPTTPTTPTTPPPALRETRGLETLESFLILVGEPAV